MIPDTIERDGIRYVLVPEAEYRRLVAAEEDRDDVRLYDQAKAAASEHLPFELAERMVAGESPIRVFREHRGLTQDRLAASAGISKPFLSQLENGLRTPSLETAMRLAAVLSVDVDDLV